MCVTMYNNYTYTTITRDHIRTKSRLTGEGVGERQTEGRRKRRREGGRLNDRKISNQQLAVVTVFDSEAS